MPFQFNQTLLGLMNEPFISSAYPPVCNEPNNNCACPTPANPDYIEDSRLRVEVVNVRHLESTTYTNSTVLADVRAWHLNQHPEDINQLNWYLKKKTFTQQVGLVSHVPQDYSEIWTDYFDENSDETPFVFNNDRILLFFKNHFPHELGHVLSMNHTFEGGSFYTINVQDGDGFWTAPYEHLDDVFRGTNHPIPILPSGLDYRDGFVGCNNFMGYNDDFDNRWISPKQMGRMHRATSLIVNYEETYFNPPPSPPLGALINYHHDARNFIYGYSEIPIVVEEDEEWNFPMKCYNDIVVKKGATLILSCRLEMVPQAKIIVEEGGTLIVDGATITSARCGGPDKEGLWRGIEVWGDINYSQTAIDADGNLRQGKIVVKNNALIEHAYVAIQANKTGSWTSGGGIILVDEAQIKNCWKGIHFSQYPNFVNISKITRTDFEINDEWKLPTKPIDFIQGWKFRGVEVSLCNFENNHSIHPMNGIYVENAHIYVRGFKPNSVDVCDDNHESWKPNRFVNLRKGIEGVWLDAIGTTRALYQKAEDMASSGNFTGAQNVMQNIDVSRLDRWETDEYYAMQYWFTLLENLHNTNRNLKALDSTELMALTVFSSNYDLYGLAGVYAKNVLNLYEPDSHFFDVVLPEQNRSHNRGESRVLKPLPNNAVITLFAYPNPTQQQATIFLNQKVQKGGIRVYNLQGVEVLQTNLQASLHCVLDFESLPNGVYFVVLIDENNTKLAETKITVSR